MTRVIAGIDPGQKWTGFIVRDGGELLHSSVYAREDHETISEYARDVVAMVGRKLDEFENPIVGIEDVNEPSPHMGTVGLASILDTARVLGWLESWCEYRYDTFLVPPDKHGTAPLKTYPAQLIGERETTGTGKGKYQHARAAWDVAEGARYYALTRASSALDGRATACE